jgi:hypothetical protein
VLCNASPGHSVASSKATNESFRSMAQGHSQLVRTGSVVGAVGLLGTVLAAAASGRALQLQDCVACCWHSSVGNCLGCLVDILWHQCLPCRSGPSVDCRCQTVPTPPWRWYSSGRVLMTWLSLSVWWSVCEACGLHGGSRGCFSHPCPYDTLMQHHLIWAGQSACTWCGQQCAMHHTVITASTFEMLLLHSALQLLGLCRGACKRVPASMVIARHALATGQQGLHVCVFNVQLLVDYGTATSQRDYNHNN